jgi:lipid-binding SYLF domain-containing protein
MKFGYRSSYAALVALLLASIVGCNTSPKSEEKKDALVDDAQASLRQMQAQDSTLQGFLDRGFGHAIFPNVGKGGLIAGGAYGRGVVYRGSEMAGYSDLSQASIGLQAGGQSFAELIVFENEDTYNKFTKGELQFGANVSAIALKTGAGSSATFKNGMAVFVMPKGGLMAELSLSGQQFKFEPK